MLKDKRCVAVLLAMLCCLFSAEVRAEEELVKFGDFESWITRSIKESAIVGGKTQKLFEVGPTGTFDGARAYTNQGGSPWACSNVYAKVYGVVKTNVSVFPEAHGNGRCAKLMTHVSTCKAMGIINISALATGCIFLGTLLEPITDTANPLMKMDMGIPFGRRPKAVKFDYKFYSPGTKRIRETGLSRRQEVSGRDMAQCVCMLQKRWEDADGNIHALRVGSMHQRFSQNMTEWKEGQTFAIHYGDITKESFYQDWMGLQTGIKAFCAKNSKGKIVPVQEEGWAKPDEVPTHIILKFDSSHGSDYTGTVGNTLWLDNIKLEY